MSQPNYGTSGDVELTDALIERLVREAEEGYDIKRLRPRPRRGRPPIGSGAADLFQVRLEPELRKALNRAAERRDVSPSELTRQALRTYLKMLKTSKKKSEHEAGRNEKDHADQPAPAGWVLMRIPDELRLGPFGIAQRCSWDINERTDNLWEVRLKENPFGTPRVSFQPEILVRASEADRSAAYGRLSGWMKQDQWVQPFAAKGIARVNELAKASRREAHWEAFQLLTLVAKDAEFPAALQALYGPIAQQLPKSSLWTVTIDPVIHARKTVIRALVADADAPELLHQSGDQVRGLEVSTGLYSSEGMGFGTLLETPLLAWAPGLFGMVATRAAGLIVMLFGQVEAGRSDPRTGPDALIDLYRPLHLSSPVADNATFQRPVASHIEELLAWWCERLNATFNVLLDPARYQKAGLYDAIDHHGELLTFDRLVAVVNAILVGSRRREEFTRRLMFFEALDILEGYRLGSYRRLLDEDFLNFTLDEVRKRIPKSIRPFLIPRCEVAIQAVKRTSQAWGITERVTAKGLVVNIDTGQKVWPLSQAVGEYIRLVRNAGHSFRESLEEKEKRSLLVSHTGRLEPEISDVAFLYFLRLVTEPDLIRG